MYCKYYDKLTIRCMLVFAPPGKSIIQRSQTAPETFKDRRNFEDDSGSHFQSQVAWSVARSESA